MYQAWAFQRSQRGDPAECGCLGLTYDRRTLEDGRSPVEDKNRFYSPEEKLADATQEAKDMSIEDHTSIVVPHCGLKLVDPYAGIYREDFSLQSI